MRPLLVSVAVTTVLSMACSGNPAAPSSTSIGSSATTLTFTAEPSGTFGPARTYTLQNATFSALSMRSGGAIEIEARPTSPTDKSGPWTFSMGSPYGHGLAPGTYVTNPFENDAGYGFLFFGYEHYCGAPGSVTIQESVITPTVVQRFRASFTIRCNGGATVRGELIALAEPWR
ncbi:MAG TPA: hypothetical protein VM096_04490 [Vicinamibacterales bacterium]|nr:hypothetical protein [Vicinamibacterales bacterium]